MLLPEPSAERQAYFLPIKVAGGCGRSLYTTRYIENEETPLNELAAAYVHSLITSFWIFCDVSPGGILESLARPRSSCWIQLGTCNSEGYYVRTKSFLSSIASLCRKKSTEPDC